MYSPTAFKDTNLPSLHRQIQQTRLAVLITQGEHGLLASHVPLLLEPGHGANGTLYGHLAKANRQWHDLAAGAEALVVFAGADAYVSPGYYPSKLENGRSVPTWNYLAVHAYGTAEVFNDDQRLHALVGSLSDHHEAGRAKPWSIDEAPADYIAGMLKAIVGFALPISRLQGQRKLSQNRSAEDVEGVRSGLAASPLANENELARLMGQEQGAR
ncbi:FMN-binding negative transcriptional regulator [Pseudomonas sp. R5(2019)]|uniref:FMN-binding negative transcriptional regulator n=1 Tax=Pseudomonas sp. R5(2019) TaxID=2697566 RepID=UPI0014136400|nr:FMN-binding negative transcriptional regulator [Pseudomonas sp. R5(2019)]NBA94482.1 FMN-binding negative transcriptional regulator [Pseudomonas sp. R5(2019)]